MNLTVLIFDWDQWNIQKNELKHGVSSLEAESVFFDKYLRIFEDIKHTSDFEKRWVCYGKSRSHRILMLAFTMRNQKVRVISARPASKKERDLYETKL